jgi:hypothetical protein
MKLTEKQIIKEFEKLEKEIENNFNIIEEQHVIMAKVNKFNFFYLCGIIGLIINLIMLVKQQNNY